MYPVSKWLVVVTVVLLVLSAVPGTAAAVGDTNTVVTVGPPDGRAADAPTDVTGEIILGEDRDMAAGGGATGTITVTVERPAAAPKERLPNGRRIVREVGQKK